MKEWGEEEQDRGHDQEPKDSSAVHFILGNRELV